jgi:DNA-binding IclR family transcriptional regulator
MPDLHCTASGKALLANAPDERREAILTSVPLTRLTDNTITDFDELRAELRTIRTQGEAVDREECYDGVQCVAVPVFAQHGECVGVSTVQFPKAPPERVAELLELTRTAAYKISRSLGHAPDAGHPTRWR